MSQEPVKNDLKMVESRDPTLDEVPIVDLKAIGLLLGYVRGSLNRRRRIFIATFVGMFAFVLTLSVIMPRTYSITTRILTHRSLVLPALVHPGRAVPPNADAPTRGAEELIKSRQNLEKLVKEINFVQLWMEHRGPVGKFKDKVRSILRPMAEADIEEALVKLLDEKLQAYVEGDVVVMTISWPDAQIAMKISEGAVARFLKLRHDMELSEIIETVNILERSVETSRSGLEVLVTRVEEVFREKEAEIHVRQGKERQQAGVAAAASRRVVAFGRPVGVGSASGDKVEQLRSELQRKQSAIENIRRSSAQRLQHAEEELAHLRATLGPEHPDVDDAGRNLEALKEQNAVPQDLMQLESEALQLTAQLERMGVPVSGQTMPSAAGEMVRLSVSEDLYAQLQTDPEITAVMEELKKKQLTHDELLGRLEDARIEIETANAAFGYRYIMTEPPQFPKKPVSPNVPIMIVGGLIAAIIFGVAMAVAADVMAGRIVEAWQVERFLGVKLLGEVPEL